MTNSERVLAYLADVASLGGTEPSLRALSERHWTIGFSELILGALTLDVTQGILEHYSSLHPGVGFGECEVPVIACLARLVDIDKPADLGQPLLLLPGLMHADGTIVPREGEPAWIPLERVARGGIADHTLTVCDIDAYRAHQIAMEKLPDDGTWSNAIVRAMDLFKAICSVDDELLARFHSRIETGECLLGIWESHDPIATSGIVLHTLLDQTGQDANPPQSVATSVLQLEDAADVEATHDGDDERATDREGEQTPPGSLFVSGMPGDMGSLSPAERDAAITLERDESTSLMALHTPKGTSSLRMALSLMGQALTNSMLRGDETPLVLCVAPHNVLSALSRLLDERPTAGQTSLSSRWLPRISYGKHDASAAHAQDRRTLGPIVSVLMQHTAGDSGAYDGGREFVQPIGHATEGVGATFSDPWYVTRATMYYLDCVSGFLGTRMRDVADASSKLLERLRLIDQDRSELLLAYGEVCEASLHMHQREDVVAQMGRLRREHAVMRKRLSTWERLAKRYPVRKNFVTRTSPTQEEVIARHAHDGEILAQGKDTVDAVRQAYQDEVDRIESEIDRLKGSSAHLARLVHAASSDGQRCSQAIARLVERCGLTTEQAALLESVIDGRDGTVRGLDEILDVTVRPAEFWLSVHVCEARWLESCSTQGDVTAATGSATPYLRTLANLCPIHLVDDDLAPSLIWETVLEHGVDPLVDLMVVLDAQNVDVPTGLALLSQARRAIVMGVQTTIRPHRLFGSISDELFATRTIAGDLWGDVAKRGLVTSGDASLFSAVLRMSDACVRNLNTVEDAYGELLDLRDDLATDERVHTMRIPASFADDPYYRLARIVPSLSYVLVPDSAWEQVGGSKQNVAEALAIVRWLTARMERIAKRYDHPQTPFVLVTSAFSAQVKLMQSLIAQQGGNLTSYVEVRALHEIGDVTWPLTLCSTTCGPQSYGRLTGDNADSALCDAAAASTDALVVFCGRPWVESSLPGAMALKRRARLMGKLFSVERKGRTKSDDAAQAQAEHETSQSELQPRVEDDLRSKPMSLTRLLQHLSLSGEFAHMPSTHDVNLALSRVGLIQRYADASGHSGWRPTASGREIGIVPATDRMGNPFCTYAASAEPVLHTIVEGLVKQQ
ncbi:MAG: hypothetical protein Q4A01_00050 [Coriobacteriales bacterium]|nr:hypothetical protein [Coriobacteriales bacterium]